MRQAAPLRFAGSYLHYLGNLDPRSLACFRLVAAGVILYDISRIWSVRSSWLGWQGFYQGLPLLAWTPWISSQQFLSLALGAYALAAGALLLGYRTRCSTLATWILACGCQYAGHRSIDYHDIVLVNLLLWCQALHLGRRFSLDAWQGRGGGTRGGVERLGAAAFVLNLAFIYLDTARRKTGGAWWGEGTAVLFALEDLSAVSDLGRWAVGHLPFWVFRLATHLTLGVEFIAPLLILSPWRRTRARLAGCALLLGFHLGLWLFMNIGSFPPTMIAGVLALFPAAFWQRLTRRNTHRPPAAEVPPGGRRAAGALLGLLFALATAINLAGHLLLTRFEEGEGGALAEWVVRLKYLLGVELAWTMYAPGPGDFGGWWVGVGLRADGREVDPITGRPPTFAPPAMDEKPFAGLGSLYWFEPPDAYGTPYYTCTRFLLAQDERLHPPAEQLECLSLFYVYEAFVPLGARPPPRPLEVFRWPEDEEARPALRRDSILRKTQIYAIDYDSLGVAGWKPTPLPPRRNY